MFDVVAGIDVAAGKQNLGREPHRFGKVRGQRRQRREKKIAEAVSLQARSFIETMTEELREQGLVFAEGDNAVADVARGEHVQFLAQAPAGAAIVTDRHHRTEIANHGRFSGRRHLRRRQHVALESLEQCGKTGAPANSNHAETARLGSLRKGRELSRLRFHPSFPAG